jgi:hypothetical protein
MRVTVHNDDGSERFSYDTNKASPCLAPSQGMTPIVVDALKEATRFLVGRKVPLLAEQEKTHG